MAAKSEVQKFRAGRSAAEARSSFTFEDTAAVVTDYTNLLARCAPAAGSWGGVLRPFAGRASPPRAAGQAARD